ncbi:hypothetical protein HLB23_36500 [Nocardia uniformis]|uniref:Uncharacterized protein n=1 Tax=Nocardia uniformis TaxID=53432 RepID=A0A849C9Q0_9NOCA|nr:hypothetical protein [Nocardia uniformis]NNH75292.1 hypothetical protein [Nocardia uniformis]
MTGWALTRTNVAAWNTGALSDLAGAVGGGNTTYADQIDRGPRHFADLNGAWAGQAYAAAYNRIGEDHWQARKINEEVTDLADLLNHAAGRLADEQSVLLGKVADAEDPRSAIAGETLEVSDVWKVIATYPPNATDDDRRTITDRVTAHQGLINAAFYSLRDAAAQFDQAIRTAAQQVRDAGSNFGDGVDAPTIPGTAIPAPDSSDPRTVASSAAFEKMFGHPPVTDVDRATANALNPNSYDPKYQGVPPNIVVARIKPVPGQGVVRTGQYIQERDVVDPSSKNAFGRNKGDNRTADPNFDPEHTRVATYVDYENGIVVFRQNPSVVQEADGSGSHVEVGRPEATVVQATDGSVRIKYDAADPIGMGGPMREFGWSVNGDLVFTPTENGVRIDGTRTNYPWLEAYQTSIAQGNREIAVDPPTGLGTGSSFGPSINLQGHHEIGSGGQALDDDKWKGWNSLYDVKVDVPGTPLGNPNTPPTVSRHPSELPTA